MCLYGPRDVARGWQEALSEHLVANGFIRGRGFPSFFFHPGRQIKTLVRGDDYVSSVKRHDLDWLQCVLEAVTTRATDDDGETLPGGSKVHTVLAEE